MTFDARDKFPIVFVGLILGKVRVVGLTGPSREIDVRCDCNLKIVLKGLGCK